LKLPLSFWVRLYIVSGVLRIFNDVMRSAVFDGVT
jgi:hypothetical protein